MTHRATKSSVLLALFVVGAVLAQDSAPRTKEPRERGIVVTLQDDTEILVSSWVFWLKDRTGSTYTPRRTPGLRMELVLDGDTRHGTGEVLDFLLRDVAKVSLKHTPPKRDPKSKKPATDRPTTIATVELKDKRTVSGTLHGTLWQGHTQVDGLKATRKLPIEDIAEVIIRPRAESDLHVDATVHDIRGAELNVTDLEFQLVETPPHLGYSGNTGIDVFTNKTTSVRIPENELIRVEIPRPEQREEKRGTKVKVMRQGNKLIEGPTQDGAQFNGKYLSGKFKGIDTKLLFTAEMLSEIKSVDYSTKDK